MGSEVHHHPHCDCNGLYLCEYYNIIAKEYYTLVFIFVLKTCFAASEDARFQAKGSTTKITYQCDYIYYLKFLAEDLVEEAPCVTNIFKIWNKHFYPETSG